MNLAVSVLVAAVCSLTSECAHRQTVSSEFDPAVPEPGYLKARVEAFYQALKSADWYTMYLITSPQTRSESPYREFAQEVGSQFEEIEAMTWRIQSIMRLDDSSLPVGASYAKVGMEIRIETVRGPWHRLDLTDYWLHLEGEWYWVWSGD